MNHTESSNPSSEPSSEQLQYVDFISCLSKMGLTEIAEYILCLLDDQSLSRAELVSRDWLEIVSDELLMEKVLTRNVREKRIWNKLGLKRGWIEDISGRNNRTELSSYYRDLFTSTRKDILTSQKNWQTGRCRNETINFRVENEENLLCLQFDHKKIVGGLTTGRIKTWDRKTLQLTVDFLAHEVAVSCLQFDDKVVFSGSADRSIKVWDAGSRELLNTLNQHNDGLVNLEFAGRRMVSCSYNGIVCVWDIVSYTEIVLIRILDHQSRLRGVAFDSNVIVSASFDRTIKVWSMENFELVKTLGPEPDSGTSVNMGSLKLQYHHPLIITSSYAKPLIEIYDVESGLPVRTLSGHYLHVTCMHFDGCRLVAGDAMGAIKVWDLSSYADGTIPPSNLCMASFQAHYEMVNCLQFDEFTIVSASDDGAIKICDFLDV